MRTALFLLVSLAAMKLLAYPGTQSVLSVKPATPMEDQTKTPIQLTPDLHISDFYFFIDSHRGLYESSLIRSDWRTVKAGQRFGFRVLFTTPKEKVKLRVELRVPSSPEKFPFHSRSATVAISQERSSVIVEDEVVGAKGTVSYYWEIGAGDPVGNYELSFSLEGVPVKSYKFAVK